MKRENSLKLTEETHASRVTRETTWRGFLNATETLFAQMNGNSHEERGKVELGCSIFAEC